MWSRTRTSRLCATLAMLACLFASAHAVAQNAFPSAAELVDAAAAWAVPVLTAELDAERAELGVSHSRARLMPAFDVSGGYTWNQVEARASIPGPTGALEDVVFTPTHQLELVARARAPLVAPSEWAAVQRARVELDAAEARLDAARLSHAEQVVMLWYEACWADASRDEAARVLATALQNADVARARRDAGLAGPLDVARAEADVARAEQQVAEADLSVQLVRNDLLLLTGVEVEGRSPALEASLVAEPELASWLDRADDAPSVAAAVAAEQVARAETRAERANWMPTVSAVIQERVSNAAGFGDAAALSAGVELGWSLDPTRFTTAQLRSVDQQAAALQSLDARRAERAAISELWHTLEARRLTALASRNEERSAVAAAAIARDRYAGGTGTQLDVSIAERDVAVAALARATAEARWLQARALLRMRTGMPVAEATR